MEGGSASCLQPSSKEEGLNLPMKTAARESPRLSRGVFWFLVSTILTLNNWVYLAKIGTGPTKGTVFDLVSGLTYVRD
jgi:hypothetical protein